MEYHRTGNNLRAAVGGPVENIIASAENWGERKTVSWKMCPRVQQKRSNSCVHKIPAMWRLKKGWTRSWKRKHSVTLITDVHIDMAVPSPGGAMYGRTAPVETDASFGSTRERLIYGPWRSNTTARYSILIVQHHEQDAVKDIMETCLSLSLVFTSAKLLYITWPGPLLSLQGINMQALWINQVRIFNEVYGLIAYLRFTRPS